jgi:hypothetical protein
MNRNDNNLRIAVITCAVLEDEVRHYARDLSQVVHIELLKQGLHNDPPLLRMVLQKAVDHVEETTDANAIVLGYGLCSRGTEGVRTRQCKLVMARAHDCITLLLGSKEKYAEYVAQNPGTYWYSPGWNRHHIPPGEERHRVLREEYLEKYGEDNADFLMETEQHWFTAYNRATYVELGVAATPQDIEFTQGCARWLNWQYDHQHGDPELLCALLEGRWDSERFIVLEPGQRFVMTADERIIEVVDPAQEEESAP